MQCREVLPPGVSIFLRNIDEKTGAPSHAQKWVFKGCIDPWGLKATKNTDNNYICRLLQSAFFMLIFTILFEFLLFQKGGDIMAKDGTNRGGARPGAGRPRKALTEKIAEGKTAEVMMQPADTPSAETPPVREFMQELQRDGTKLLADEVYTETYQWLKERSCEKIVSRQLVEQYAMSISRWIHCEQIVTKYGYISKHPTTGAAIASPYVAMSQNYMKQANQIWNQIFQIVRENCSVEFQGNPNEDMMEKLLRSRK